jgi:flagellar secretion chaperone FliS
MQQKTRQYQSIGVQTSIMDADPHRLIQLLFDGAMQNMSAARGFIERSDIENKNARLNKAIEIVGGLRNFLDKEKGGEVAANLEKLYEYIEVRLFQANARNSAEYVDECVALLKQVKSAWDEIRPVVAKSATAGVVSTSP